MKLLLVLLSSCSIAILGDAEARCHRWTQAMANYATRCANGTVKTPAYDCSGLLSFELDIEECEAELLAAPCVTGYLPKKCAANMVKSPL